MNRKAICLFFLLCLALIAYIAGYVFMAWPLENEYLYAKSKVLPVTAGKENFILPETKLTETIVDLKNGITSTETKTMPSIYLGLEREELIQWLNDYMNNLPIDELEKGLVSYELESYSTEEVLIKKQYYQDDNYHHYYMIYKNGRIAVYYSDKKTLYEYPNIRLADLPLDLQYQTMVGMPIKDEVELYNFLQNYSS